MEIVCNKFYSKDQTLKLLNISDMTFVMLIKENRLKYYKWNQSYYLKGEWLIECMEKNNFKLNWNDKNSLFDFYNNLGVNLLDPDDKDYCTVCNKKINEKHAIMHKKEYKEYQNSLRKIHDSKLSTTDKKRERRNLWFKYKNKVDPSFKIINNLRRRIWKSLKGILKTDKTINLIGCTIEELKKHLEKQFQPGMTWVNYGKDGWEVDHIKPCASFDLSDPQQQKICFHYTNLQPLWGKDNWSKKDKIIWKNKNIA